MSYVQVITPSVNIPCTPGYCLAYVQSAYGAPWAGSTATDAWNRAQKKHVDSNFPNGVAVPVYFAMSGVDAGHIVIRMGDGSIYSTSSATSTTPTHHANLAALLSYYGGMLTLRGWSEDLNGTVVIKEGGNMPSYTGLAEARIDAYAIGGRNGLDGTANALGGECDDDLNKYHVNQESNGETQNWYNSAEGQNWRFNRLPALVAKAKTADALSATVDELNKRIAQLPNSDAVKTLQASLDAANAQVKQAQDEEAALKQQLADAEAEVQSLQAQSSADQQAGDSFLRRLGQFISKYLPGGNS